MFTRPRTGFSWRSASATATGNVRAHNEDSVLDLPEVGLWVVADGMGGHNAGDVASRMIVETLAQLRRRSPPSALLDDLEDRLSEVNARLYNASLASNGGTSGSTVVALLALERHCVTLWAGDSRLYRSRDRSLVQITRDHSEAQELLEGGLLEAYEVAPSNVITRAVGGDRELHLDIELCELRHRDRFLLCSDGLYRELNEGDMSHHLAANDPRGACKALMKQALAGPCTDNVSVVVVEFTEA
ncbi:MAG: serine/threonine protein phosphatase [Proteobacteria bacterium]|nr:MAG: serine/threonine protein phosphatase [Pseudomonadota bacterium]